MGKAKKESVIIIGAGAAGLMAANELADDFHVLVLEAQHRIGGRIRTIGNRLEAGPEFIHGKLPLTFGLAKKAGATIEEIDGNRYRVKNCRWREQDEMIEGWDLVLERMAQLEEDLTLDAFLETHFADSKYETLRHDIRSYATGFDLADTVKASAKSLYREWAGESEDMYRIKEGYSSIIRYLEKECLEKNVTILTNKTIRQINWKENTVTLTTDAEKQFDADKLIVTVPAGVMQNRATNHSIQFIPALDEYDHAWQKIGYGTVLKILLQFKSAFWRAKEKDTGFIISDEAVPTWWTQLPSKEPILTGWIGGTSALQWDLVDDQKVIELAVTSLSNIFAIKPSAVVDQLEQHFIFRWHADPAALGAYSYETPYSTEARQLLNTPVMNTLFFAGEALYEGAHPGTVEAALQSGLNVANKMILPE